MSIVVTHKKAYIGWMACDSILRNFSGGVGFVKDCTYMSALDQWPPTLGLQMFLDFSSQKSCPAEVAVKASGSCSPRTSGGPSLGNTALDCNSCFRCWLNLCTVLLEGVFFVVEETGKGERVLCVQLLRRSALLSVIKWSTV